MARAGKICLFCGITLVRGVSGPCPTDEHIIPKWLQYYLGINATTVSPLLVETAELKPVDSRHHAVGSFVAGSVCEACNGGWMSRLEVAVKPLLTGLIESTINPGDLDRQQRFTLAQWTLKTASALNRTSSYANPKRTNSRAVPDAHLRTLAAERMPPEVLIVATTHEGFDRHFDFLQYAQWRNPQNSIALQEDHRSGSYKIALTFRRLILIAAYYPSDDYAYGLNTLGCVPLWCGRRVVEFNHIWDDTLSKTLAPRLEVPLRNISVVSHTWMSLVDNVTHTRFIQLP